jgi:hypothetical protein
VGLLACQTRSRSSIGSLEKEVKVGIVVVMIVNLIVVLLGVLVVVLSQESLDKYRELV